MAWTDWTVEVGAQRDRGVLPLRMVLMESTTLMLLELAMMLVMMSDMEKAIPTSMEQEVGEDTTEVELGPPISLLVLVVEVTD